MNLQKLNLVFIISSIVLPFCLTSANAGTTDYTVTQGAHYAFPRTDGFFFQSGMKFTARFDDSAIYDP